MAGPRSDPITFQSVTAKSDEAANALIADSIKRIGAGVDSLGNRIGDYGDLKTKEATDEFTARVNAAGSQEERNSLLANADKSFLDIGAAAKAITAAQNQGFRVAADERAGQTLDELLRKNKVTEALDAEKFKSSELQNAITNARADEALVDSRDSAEDAHQLAKDKFIAEEKRCTATANRQKEEDAYQKKQRQIAEDIRLATEPTRIQELEEKKAKLDEERRVRIKANNDRIRIESQRTAHIDSTESFEKKLRAINEDMLDNDAAGISNDHLSKPLDRLITQVNKDVTPSIEAEAQSMLAAATTDAGVDITQFSVDAQQALEQKIQAVYTKAFPALTADKTLALAKAAVKKNNGLNANFASGAKALGLKNDIADQSTQGILERFGMTIEDRKSFKKAGGAAAFIDQSVRTRMPAVDWSNQSIAKDLQASIATTLQTALTKLGITSAVGQEQVKLAVLDIYRQVAYDHDPTPGNPDDFVLSADNETDVSELNFNILMQYMQQSFGKGTVLGDVLISKLNPGKGKPKPDVPAPAVKALGDLEKAFERVTSQQSSPGPTGLAGAYKGGSDADQVAAAIKEALSVRLQYDENGNILNSKYSK